MEHNEAVFLETPVFFIISLTSGSMSDDIKSAIINGANR
jgi:hypothetical protein